MTQPIDRETAIALAKEAGMAGMLTDVVCSLEEIHRLCNLAVAHSRKDAEPVAYRFTHNRGNGATAFTYHDNTEHNNWRTAYKDTCLVIDKMFLHPPEADKLLQQALEYAKLMKLYGPAIGFGNTTIDDHIAALRTYLEGK